MYVSAAGMALFCKHEGQLLACFHLSRHCFPVEAGSKRDLRKLWWDPLTDEDRAP